MILHPGAYKTRSGKVWLPVLIRVENSRDEDGRVADRPRLVLYLGGERHERPSYETWGHRIWAVTQEEFDRLSRVHSPETASPKFRLADAPPLF